MNFLSFFRHLKVIVTRICLLLILVGIVVGVLSGCYSFTGGSVPPHLKTISIPTAEDVSGFGDARYRELLTQRLVQNFRNDNSLVVVQERSDATLTVTLTAITDITASVTPGELERERKVTVAAKAMFMDVVKKQPVWQSEKTFSQFRVYAIADGFQGRDAAIQRTLQLISDDILLAVVSGW